MPKITEYATVTSLTGTEELVVSQGGVTKKTTIGSIPVTVAQLPAVGMQAWCAGKPGNSEVVGGGVAPYAFTISAGVSTIDADTAATASTVFTLKGGAAGTTTIGTWTLAASGTTATLSISGSASVSAGDKLRIVAPATADSTAANLNFVVRRA